MLSSPARVRSPLLTRRDVVAVAGAASLVAVVHFWGSWLQARGAVLLLHGAQPLTGPVTVRVNPMTAVVAGFAALMAWRFPRYCRDAGWSDTLVAGTGVAALWSVLLALIDGVHGGLVRRITGSDEYLHDVPKVPDLGSLFGQFSGGINQGDHPWTTHVAGHPPGALFGFVALDRIGLGGAGGAVLLCVGGAALAVPAAALTIREVVDEAAARAALPFLALAPTAVWAAVSADGWFLGVTAWGIACLALAAGRRGAGGDAFALAGGVLLGCALYLSYGLVLAGLPAVCVVLARRTVRPLVVGAAGALCVVGAATWAGFWWMDGLALTAARLHGGEAGARPFLYFAVANAAALAVAVGPAAVAGVTRLRGRMWWVSGGALGALALADLSGLARGEVERIWLPFTPYLLAATALLPARARRGWLVAQLAAAIVVQSVVKSW